MDDIKLALLGDKAAQERLTERMGLEINFREGVERIREVEEA